MAEEATGTAAALAARIREAGVAGAGGAGFPTYAKWEQLDEVDAILMNHEESEPNYYSDKWLVREHADVYADLFDQLLETSVGTIVVGGKEDYRDAWMDPLEEATGGAVYGKDDLPVAVDDELGVVFAYTDDVYDFSEEQVLLMIAVGERIGRDLPTDHGWLVQNSESMYNIARALDEGTPVTRKYVHVDGDTPRHRCLDVPVGTTGATLLDEAGLDADELDAEAVLADGGPGWCYEIDESPAAFGVRKRTNAVLVLGREEVDEHTELEDRINVLEARDWHDREHETRPMRVDPDRVRIPLITNAAYDGLVSPSRPTVTVGDAVTAGDVIADPAPDAISIPQHASIDGEVAAVTETHVVIER